MSGLMAAGQSCDGSSFHGLARWEVTADRLVRLPGVDEAAMPLDLKHALRLPIPGTARVLDHDVHKGIALCADASEWRLDRRAQVWRSYREGDMKATPEAPALLAAGAVCNVRWKADRERFIWISIAGRDWHRLAPLPVPGNAKLLAVEPAQKAVTLDSDCVLAWIAGRWSQVSGAGGAGGKMRVKLTVGLALGPPDVDRFVDTHPGDELSLPESSARRLIEQGRAVAAAESETAS